MRRHRPFEEVESAMLWLECFRKNGFPHPVKCIYSSSTTGVVLFWDIAAKNQSFLLTLPKQSARAVSKSIFYCRLTTGFESEPSRANASAWQWLVLRYRESPDRTLVWIPFPAHEDPSLAPSCGSTTLLHFSTPRMPYESRTEAWCYEVWRECCLVHLRHVATPDPSRD